MERYINPEKIKLNSLSWIDGEGDILVPLVEVKKAIAQTPTENVIELPCKVGDTLYIIGEITKQIVYDTVHHIVYNGDDFGLAMHSGVYVLVKQQLGKTVFLTRAEAKKALAERKENDT